MQCAYRFCIRCPQAAASKVGKAYAKLLESLAEERSHKQLPLRRAPAPAKQQDKKPEEGGEGTSSEEKEFEEHSVANGAGSTQQHEHISAETVSVSPLSELLGVS